MENGNEREDLMEDRELYLVTGGAGFIGSHIAEALVKRGDRWRVLDSLITGRRGEIYHRSPQGRIHRG